MPPRGTSPEAGRGRGGRGGGRGGFRGGRGGFRGGDDRGSGRGRGRGRGRGDRGAGGGSGGGNRGRSRGAGGPSGATPSYGPQLELTSHRETLQIPDVHIQAIGEKRKGYGTAAERRVRVITNHVEVKLDQGFIYHYDVVILPEEDRPIARNYRIIQALQTEVEGRLSTQPGVYDGKKNFFTSFDLEYEDGAREYVVPMGPKEFKVRLTYVASINPELLKRFVQGKQDHDNAVFTAIMALNMVIRMRPIQAHPFNKRSFFADRETKDIGGGVVLWRGYFQSVRPAINRMLINVNITTGPMYKPGRLIDLALEFLGNSRQSANTLSPLHGFPDRERMRLQQFLSGLKVTTPHNEHDPGRQRLVKKLSRQGARDVSFETADGQSMTVADYFQDRLNGPLRFPDVICVELSTRAVIPLELCEVPPGQLIRKQMPPEHVNSILRFSSMRPNERHNSIRNALTVLEYGQSEYVRQFGMTIADNELLALEARVIKAPVLNYHPNSRQPRVKLDTGKSTWNLIDRLMYQSSTIENWILVIYETRRRFRQEIAEQMVGNLVKGGRSVGITINPRPLMRWESGQGNIAEQLRAACNACQRQSGSAPTLIVVVLPEGGNDIYTAVKNFGDVTAGIPTQCMKAAKCFRAREQYFANVLLKINVRLGGINVVPEPQDISFLTDPAHPAMVMGADITHAPPGSRGKPSFTALVGSIDSNAVKYVSRMGVQRSSHEVIEDLEEMCVEVLKEFKDARNTYPERILFFRDGVSETEFSTILEIELLYIRNACQTLGFAPTITFIVVGKKHKVVFFPTGTSPNDSDSSGNCLAGMVVDTDITSPVETDWYLLSHSGILGTSRPAHYNLLLDENEFTVDGIQRLSYALCYVYARCTRSVSVPAPIYYAHNVCMRAKNHYDPQLRHDVFLSETATETSDPRGSTSESEIRRGFQPTNERMARLMYFI